MDMEGLDESIYKLDLLDTQNSVSENSMYFKHT